MITQQRLREMLHYDAETGVFTWRIKRTAGVKPGDKAGCSNSLGYIIIGLTGRRYRAHRLAWLYVHGVWPEQSIDHANGITGDNRMINLREATSSENRQNIITVKTNTSGFTGVTQRKNERWEASIKINYKTIHLGSYASPESAYHAYLVAKRQYHPFQPVPRAGVPMALIDQ